MAATSELAIALETRPVVPELSPDTLALTMPMLLFGPRLLLPILSLILIAAIACGTDRGGNEPAAVQF